jgi:2,4-dienoyl-CoA reductase-like NADH-dependent reductase (Old Yellow Enzyme family)
MTARGGADARRGAILVEGHSGTQCDVCSICSPLSPENYSALSGSTVKNPNLPLLFEPIQFRSVTVRNRIMISPMCQYCAPQAIPNDWHFVHLGSRAAGGAGIAMTEATAVEPAGRITPFDVGLWNDDQEAAFARIASFVAAQGAIPGIQLAHAGRKASHARPWEQRRPLTVDQGGWEVVGPSSIPWAAHDLVPRELTTSEIGRVIQDFQQAARRALRAGFRLLELHAAHGYLVHSFLSPLSNVRTDSYGGRFENRVRLLLEMAAAIREVWPAELPFFVRLSATDWAEGGWDIEDTVKAATMLASLGVDLIDCSSGGAVPNESLAAYPGYQVPFAETVRRNAGVPTAAVGLLGDPFAAEAILAQGQADLVALGRISLWDPYWPYHAASALGMEATLPIQYERGRIHAERHAQGPP